MIGLVDLSETRQWILPCNRYGLPRPYGSDSILDMSVDPSSQAQLVFRSGLAALVPGMFGMGWLGWGLGIAHAFTPLAILLFDVVGILILGSSIYFIRKGRSLRRSYPAFSDPQGQKMRKQFLVVVMLEFMAIGILSRIAYVIHRPDLAPVLAAIVVGLHFLPLGKIFRQARYYFWGDRDSALVRFLRILVPFQYARGVEQHRDGRSALGLLRARFTASPRNRAFTCPATRRFADK